MAKGRFITFEGGEGSGKSTQVEMLAKRLSAAGLEVLETREPGGSEGAEDIRELLIHGDSNRWDAVSEALLHFAARRDHLVKTVWPALAAGRWVLSDRFADSTMAYQGYGHDLGSSFVRSLYDLVVGKFMPDLTIIFDLPVEIGLQRARSRAAGGERYEKMGTAFHERIRAGFLEIARAAPERCIVVDAQRPVDSVHEQVLKIVSQKFGMKTL